MNYRHAFHAGNFADCVKHALLVWLLDALARKPGGLFVLDTHAGAGRYDLGADPAERTGEARGGILRLLAARPPPLARYLGLVQACGLYPGSPALIRALLRPQDRLAACELHPDDAAALRHAFAGDPLVAVHARDGWEALRALLPPARTGALRRGLVLIDPPYERTDEVFRLARLLPEAAARFPVGVFAAWYPIKHRAPARTLHAAITAAGTRDVLAAELWLREPTDPARLNGCGLLIVRPPYGFEEAAPPMLVALAQTLGEADAGWRIERLADE